MASLYTRGYHFFFLIFKLRKNKRVSRSPPNLRTCVFAYINYNVLFKNPMAGLSIYLLFLSYCFFFKKKYGISSFFISPSSYWAFLRSLHIYSRSFMDTWEKKNHEPHTKGQTSWTTSRTYQISKSVQTFTAGAPVWKISAPCMTKTEASVGDRWWHTIAMQFPPPPKKSHYHLEVKKRPPSLLKFVWGFCRVTKAADRCPKHGSFS